MDYTAVEVRRVTGARGQSFWLFLKSGEHIMCSKSLVRNWHAYEEGDENVAMDIETNFILRHEIKIEAL